MRCERNRCNADDRSDCSDPCDETADAEAPGRRRLYEPITYARRRGGRRGLGEEGAESILEVFVFTHFEAASGEHLGHGVGGFGRCPGGSA